jgi:hypothetical protein
LNYLSSLTEWQDGSVPYDRDEDQNGLVGFLFVCLFCFLFVWFFFLFLFLFFRDRVSLYSPQALPGALQLSGD